MDTDKQGKNFYANCANFRELILRGGCFSNSRTFAKFAANVFWFGFASVFFGVHRWLKFFLL